MTQTIQLTSGLSFQDQDLKKDGKSVSQFGNQMQISPLEMRAMSAFSL